MSIPEFSKYDGQEFFAFNWRRIETKRTFSWLPKKCFLSDKILWLKPCYTIKSRWNDFGSDKTKTFWVDIKEFIINDLKFHKKD